MARFIQRKFLATRKYTLLDKGVHVEEGGVIRSQSYTVPFEHISAEKVEIRTSSQVSFWACVILFSLAAFLLIDSSFGGESGRGASLFYGFFGVLAGLAYLRSRERFVGFRASGGFSGLLFWNGRPSEDAVEAFVSEMELRRATSLRREHVRPPSDHLSPVEEIERLVVLRERDAISQEEFEQLKAAILGMSRGPIGFN